MYQKRLRLNCLSLLNYLNQYSFLYKISEPIENNNEDNNPKNNGRSLLKIEAKSKYPAKLVNTSFPNINKTIDPSERNNENIENNIIKTAFFFVLKQDI